ncbi:MAG: hypothetical protein QM308_06355 [Bacillota bacterium]|nr:hypothetical protein [Bacillota bacterium]
MLRLRKKQLREVTCLPTQAYTDTTGGIGRVTTGNHFTFKAALLPPKRAITRTVSGVRLALTWTLLPEGAPPCREQDRLVFPGDSRVFTITAIKRSPRFLAFHLELL